MKQIAHRQTAPRAWLCPRGHINFGHAEWIDGCDGMPLVCDICNVVCLTGTDISDPSNIYRFRAAKYWDNDSGLAANRA